MLTRVKDDCKFKLVVSMTTIRAIDRAFEILETIASYPDGIAVNELARQVELPKSTTSRILTTLENWQAVKRTDAKRFVIGQGLNRLSEKRSDEEQLRVLALPYLKQLVDATGEAAALCVRRENEVLYLENVQSPQAVRVRNWKGECLPMHVVSAGKVILAFGEPEYTEEILEYHLEGYTPNTIEDVEVLRQELKQIRRDGYASGNEEFEDDVCGFSVPIMRDDTLMAAINVYGPKFRLLKSKDAILQQMLPLVDTLST